MCKGRDCCFYINEECLYPGVTCPNTYTRLTGVFHYKKRLCGIDYIRNPGNPQEITLKPYNTTEEAKE